MRQDTHLQITFLFLSLSFSFSFSFSFLAAFIRVADERGRKRKEVQKSRFAHFARNGSIGSAALHDKWTTDKKRDRPRPAGLRDRIQCISVSRTTAPNDSLLPRVHVHTSPFHRVTYRVDQVRRIHAVIQTIDGIYIRPIE